MPITDKHRKGYWAKRIIYRFGGIREKAILHNATMILLEDDVVEVRNDKESCFVHIPEYNDASCRICG